MSRKDAYYINSTIWWRSRAKKRLILIWLSSATQWSLLSQSFKIWSRDQELSSEVFIIMMTSSVTSQLKPQGYEGFQTFFGISAYARPPTTLKVVPKCSPHHSASFYMTWKKCWFSAKKFSKWPILTEIVWPLYL